MQPAPFPAFRPWQVQCALDDEIARRTVVVDLCSVAPGTVRSQWDAVIDRRVILTAEHHGA